MANSLLTISDITRESIILFMNSNAFLGNIDTQYDDYYSQTGAKIGQQLRIRLPNDYIVSDGPALQVQDTNEQQIVMTLAFQRHVDVSFNSVDRTLSLDDYSERVLAPQVNNLAGNVAATIMSGGTVSFGPYQGTQVNGVVGSACNYVANVDGTGAITAPVLNTWTKAGAYLDANSAQTMDRKAVLDPFTMANTVGSFSGLLNPAPDISKQYRNARIYDALNYEWFQDQTVVAATCGSFTTGTLNAANQNNTSTLTVSAISGTLNKGDIITVAGVYAVNRVTKQATAQLRQFVVTSAVANGATSIPIYPALVAPLAGQPVQYQTVSAIPASNAAVTQVTPASGTYRANFVFAKQAVTMVTADLEMPAGGVIEAARAKKDGLSMRMISQYIIGTDQTASRLDILFGWCFPRGEWMTLVADSTS